eukprot:1596072-Rhodomonas_salina.5
MEYKIVLRLLLWGFLPLFTYCDRVHFLNLNSEDQIQSWPLEWWDVDVASSTMLSCQSRMRSSQKGLSGKKSRRIRTPEAPSRAAGTSCYPPGGHPVVLGFAKRRWSFAMLRGCLLIDASECCPWTLSVFLSSASAPPGWQGAV